MRRVFLLVLLVSLITAAASAEARVGVPHAEPFAAPQLAGDEVVHGVVNPDGTLQLRATNLATGPGSVVRSFDRPDKRAQVVKVRFAATENALVSDYEQYAESRGYILVQSHVFQVGALGGAARSPECKGAFAVTAGRIARSCGAGQQSRITVEDAATGDVLATVEHPGGRSDPIQLVDVEGSLLAYTFGTSRDGVVVVDYLTGRELYRVSGASVSADLDRDGTLVRRVQRMSACDAVEWFSPAEPTAHPVQVCGQYGALAISDGRIATTASVGQSKGLMLVDQTGTALKWLPNASAADLDSNHLAFRCADRDGAWVDHVGEAVGRNPCTEPLGSCSGDPGPAVYGRPDNCPAWIKPDRVRVSAGGTASVRVACVRGCTASLVLRTRGAGASANKPFTLKHGTTTVRVRVSSPRRIPRAGKLVRAVVRTRDVEGVGERYEKTIRVLPPK